MKLKINGRRVCLYGWESPLIVGPIEVGKYCSFGPGVRRFPVNHAIDMITTSRMPLTRYVAGEKDMREYTMLTIGNDVWIGADAIILPNVKTIGDGVIIELEVLLQKTFRHTQLLPVTLQGY